METGRRFVVSVREMNTPVPSRSSSSALTVAIVGIAGAVAGSLAVWTALAPGEPNVVDQTCRCECITEAAPTPAPPTLAEGVPSSGQENGGPHPVAAKAPPAPPRVRQAKAEVVGPLDRDLIRRIVRAHISEVRHCYNQGLVTDPELSGRVAVQFTIGSAGKVLESVVASSTLDEDDDAVASCTASAVKRWKFPKSKGEAVVVTYPFVLTPGD